MVNQQRLEIAVGVCSSIVRASNAASLRVDQVNPSASRTLYRLIDLAAVVG